MWCNGKYGNAAWDMWWNQTDEVTDKIMADDAQKVRIFLSINVTFYGALSF